MNYVSQHWTVISSVVAYVALAAIRALPAPGRPFNWYEWFYDTAQSLANKPAPRP